MSSQEPPGAWPPPYPTQGDPPTAPRYPGGPTPPAPVDKGRIWGVALITGGVAYCGLLAAYLPTESSGSAAFRAGQMLPIAAGTAVVVALLAQATRTRQGWPWWAISLAVLGASAAWYSVVVVAPRVTNDARAEATGQADYRLTAPDRAGDWARLDGASARQREQAALSRLEEAPEDLREAMSDAVYGEYRSGTARLVFFGFNTSGALQNDARESSSKVLRDFMAGSGAENPESVDAGDLGGSMACTGDARDLPPGLIYCAWADGSTLGQVTVVALNLDIDDAAEITRELREGVTER